MAFPNSTQRVQLGFESPIGTGTSANRQCRAIAFTFKPEIGTKQFSANGRRFMTHHVVNTEWVSFTFTGEGSYTELLFILENLFGTSSVTDVGSTNQGKQRNYTPGTTGDITPRSWFIEWGDANNVNEINYGIVTGIEVTYDRQNGVSYSGEGFARKHVTGAGFTSSPAFLSSQPIAGGHINVYADSASGSIGGTQLTTTFLSATWSYKNAFAPFWDADRAQTSFRSHVSMKPQTELKLVLAENSTSRTLSVDLATGVTRYIRLQCQGANIETSADHLFQTDIAAILKSREAWTDVNGVYAREYNFDILDDGAWGKALDIRVTNTVSSAQLG
jgi:hypothetical protein